MVGGNHETSQRVVDAIFKALAPALPDRVSAGGPTTAGLMIFGARRPDGRWAVLYEVHGGGEGATATKDGAAATRVHMSNVMNTPVEVIEGEYPLRVEEQALRPGSGGDGAHRGGLGLRRAYRVLGRVVTLTTMLERRVVPPYGLAGGGDGAPFRITLNPGTARARDVRGKETLTLADGDLVVIETCGGGGFGPPDDRPPALAAPTAGRDTSHEALQIASRSSPAPPRAWAATSARRSPARARTWCWPRATWRRSRSWRARSRPSGAARWSCPAT